MRKLLIVIAVTLAVAALAVAQGLPNQLEVWKWDGENNEWDFLGFGTDADAWAFSTGMQSGECNKQTWNINVGVDVSVAQWIEWSLTASKWKWYVRKPGMYVADCITANLKSNGPVKVKVVMGNITGGNPNTNSTIESWYGADFAAQSPGNVAYWLPAPIDYEFTVPDSNTLHAGYAIKLWNKINVVECNSACEYSATGTITLTLQTIKPWIDPETGNFKSDYSYLGQ
ncbi:hypothetical protein [Pseudothermotoga thermarum]|uniref:Uncharacterized protein n=1 Tax=Pseudothermotoga thermarum DSM 5069 TaxID=688269 RepID=F7YX21_9THEM|nr:hypothetical protein [Pseudothermotoga thermarum]AEH50596.1 hypothetical protein Theth_0507 [Pseudothermotoga thermarum DSM 5069]